MMMAKRLIRTLPEFEEIRESDVRIAYLSSHKQKKRRNKIIYGECHKVDEKYAWCCHYDFFIMIYEPNIMDFTDKQIETLIRHELHHVGISFEGEDISYYIEPHDIEEFWEIIHDCGLDWSEVNATG